jgi:hypothetical protein
MRVRLSRWAEMHVARPVHVVTCNLDAALPEPGQVLSTFSLPMDPLVEEVLAGR